MNIQIGNLRFMPALFVIGEPYDRQKYENGEQAVFLPTVMIEGLEGRKGKFEINPEGLYEFNLSNLTTVENQFDNVRIIPIENLSNATPEVVLTDDVTYDYFGQTKKITKGATVPGIKLNFDNFALLNKISARGLVNGVEGDIDLTAVDEIIPFKMTPTSIQDKITMFVD